MTDQTRLIGGRPVVSEAMQPRGVAPLRDRTPAVAQTDDVSFRPLGRIAAEMALRAAHARKLSDDPE